jgi:hypothetical protein
MAEGEERREGEEAREGESPAERKEPEPSTEAEAGQPSEGGDPSAAPETPQEIEEPESPGAQPDAPEDEEDEQPRTSEGGVQPEPDRSKPVESAQPQSVASPGPPAEEAEEAEAQGVPGRPLLVFLNEVAGGRKLLEQVTARESSVPYVAVVAPQNQPAAGQIIDTAEIRDAARSRVDVTMAVFAGFGIESVGDVMDPDPSLALDDAIRAHEPGEVLLSSLPDTRFGFTRKDLVEWARASFEPEVQVTHVPVRIEDDSIRWDVIHTLVVATQTVHTPDLMRRLKERAAERPHRYTIICPRSEQISREQVCDDLAATLAELYREDVDATGQPMSPDPFHAVQNAIAHYRIDEVLISTLAGEQSKWLEEDLIGRVREITEKPVEHIEAGRPPEKVAAAVAAEPAGAEGS